MKEKTVYKKVCPICKNKFESNRSATSTCSADCRIIYTKILSQANNKRVSEERRHSLRIFQMECPYESGRLPLSVTANQCYG